MNWLGFAFWIVLQAASLGLIVWLYEVGLDLIEDWADRASDRGQRVPGAEWLVLIALMAAVALMALISIIGTILLRDDLRVLLH